MEEKSGDNQLQIALSIGHMKDLESMGIDTTDASLAWIGYFHSDGKTIERYFLIEYPFGKAHQECVPAYTVEDMVKKMPCYIPSREEGKLGYVLRLGAANPNQYFCAYEAIDNNTAPLMIQYGGSLIEAVFYIFKYIIALKLNH